MKRILVAGLIALSGCTAAQTSALEQGAAKADSALQIACGDALLVANLAGLVPGVGSIIPYINAGCATADGLAKLAADPSSAEWVGTLIGKVKALAGGAGLKL